MMHAGETLRYLIVWLYFQKK